jgi:thiaminase/transcriptional activator TenA
MTLTKQLWDAGAVYYDAILVHPFLTELTAGTLPRELFRDYVVQDNLYLRDYARALSALAARAPDAATTSLLATHAAGSVAAEQALHAELLQELPASDPAGVLPGPTTTAYTSFLLASTHGGSFAEGLAAVLPCYWIYEEVGTALVAASSPDPVYSRWIAAYGGVEFAAMVRSVLEVAEGVLEHAGDDLRQRMAASYATAARYEWMFWDAAYRGERWPL